MLIVVSLFHGHRTEMLDVRLTPYAHVVVARKLDAPAIGAPCPRRRERAFDGQLQARLRALHATLIVAVVAGALIRGCDFVQPTIAIAVAPNSIGDAVIASVEQDASLTQTAPVRRGMRSRRGRYQAVVWGGRCREWRQRLPQTLQQYEILWSRAGSNR